jgi:hypothetical protein
VSALWDFPQLTPSKQRMVGGGFWIASLDASHQNIQKRAKEGRIYSFVSRKLTRPEKDNELNRVDGEMETNTDTMDAIARAVTTHV